MESRILTRPRLWDHPSLTAHSGTLSRSAIYTCIQVESGVWWGEQHSQNNTRDVLMKYNLVRISGPMALTGKKSKWKNVLEFLYH